MTRMVFHIVTLFPESFDSYLKSSILARAIQRKIISVEFYNPRDYAPRELRKVWPDGNVTTYIDGRPYGGGPGMVLRPEPILRAVQKIQKKSKTNNVILFSTNGEPFTNRIAEKYSKSKIRNIILICGRYEGIDNRVSKVLKAKEVSVGPYILTGGELPALIVIDAISRRIQGVLNKKESLEENRVSSSEIYTRPEVLEWGNKKYRVPKVLLSGNQKLIDAWKRGDTQKRKNIKNRSN